MVHSFADSSTLINPTSFFRQLRHERPVYFDETLSAYVITGYDDIQTVFKQPNLFSSALALFNAYNFEEIVNSILVEKAHGPFQSILPMTDPPEHTRIRKALNMAFSMQRVAKFQDYIESEIDGLFKGFIDKGSIDVMADLAIPLPVSIIAHLLSVPKERMADIKRWTQSYTACAGNRIATEADAIRIGNDLAEMQNFIVGHIRERRNHHYDDVLTDIVNAEGGTLTDGEVLAIAAAFLVAGHETGSLVIVSLFKTLAENPSLIEYLRNAEGEDKDKIYKAFIEEALRLNAPVRMLPRVTTDIAEVGGVQIPAGSLVFIVMASANMDEAIFGENCEEFIPDRKNSSRHLSFGSGPHVCIGNMLARTELKCLLMATIEKIDSMELADKEIPLTDYSPVVLDINVHLHKLNLNFTKK